MAARAQGPADYCEPRHAASDWHAGLTRRDDDDQWPAASAYAAGIRGKIERNASQSTPYWPMRVVPPKGAPNVLLIMTDDTGFGVSSTFGGVIPTPNLDRIAANGLRYTNFNSTALCSPSRTPNGDAPSVLDHRSTSRRTSKYRRRADHGTRWPAHQLHRSAPSLGGAASMPSPLRLSAAAGQCCTVSLLPPVRSDKCVRSARASLRI
jgi:hypothetical protein